MTLLDGNNSTNKDDSSRSTTTSPIIEPSKEHERISQEANQDDYNGNTTNGDKSEENESFKEHPKSKASIDANDVKEDNEDKDQNKVSQFKKYDYLGLYDNRPVSPERSIVHGNKVSTDNNNRKTNNAKVRHSYKFT